MLQQQLRPISPLRRLRGIAHFDKKNRHRFPSRKAQEIFNFFFSSPTISGLFIKDKLAWIEPLCMNNKETLIFTTDSIEASPERTRDYQGFVEPKKTPQ